MNSGRLHFLFLARRLFSSSTARTSAWSSSLEYIAPVGLFGELMMMARVRDEMAAEIAGTSKEKSSLDWTGRSTPPKCPQ